MGAETHIDIRRMQAGDGDYPSGLRIISSDDSINVDMFDDGYDLTLNTDIVELIDFTNFHNTYIEEVTDWTSEHGATLKHQVVHCSLADEDITIVDTSQAGTPARQLNFNRTFYYERATEASSVVYIPLIAIRGTDFTCSIIVSFQFGIGGSEYHTKCIVLGDNPDDLTWCFCKNVPFILIGKIDDRAPHGQLYEFIEIPTWFVGRIEISIDKINARVLGTVFSLHEDSTDGILPTAFNGGNDSVELYAFSALTSYTYIDPDTQQSVTCTFDTIPVSPTDKYGVLDVDFFVDSMSVLEIQSDNSIPDWIINDLCVHELLLQSKMKDIIIKNIQSSQLKKTTIINIDSTDDEVPTAKTVYDFVTTLLASK